VLVQKIERENGSFGQIMVIISNGFSKFYLSVAAVEADQRHLLTCLLTGAYPTPLVRQILSLPYLRSRPKARRLAARREPIADSLVHALFTSESLYEFGRLRQSSAIMVDSLRLYGWSAIHHIKRAAAKGARIYHFRAGFGGESVEVARRLGMFILCDHSIAHPATVEALVSNMGRLPTQEEMANVDPFWTYILHDIEQADAILVNSLFVEDTFRHIGFDHSPVHVMYLGVDDAFFAQVPQRESATDAFCMLFAGSFEKRKGAETLISALGCLNNIPWQLEIAGPLDTGVVDRHREFFVDARVTCLGLLSRPDLAKAMSRADVFIFPSLAEGSARVIFEALACGCFVITTPNSGSIVEEGVHGSVVSAGDSSSLARAVENAFRSRDAISVIGRNNAQLVREKFTQRDYGNQLANLYRSVLGA
jgi:glycosyltransferase involved in cell wall biosynthesis